MINLPNLLTLTNLLLGCASLLFLFTGAYDMVLYCLIGAAVADVFDGLAARALNIKSELGKELDSIADMVSFGLVPGAIFYVLLLAGEQGGTFQELVFSWRAFPAFLLTAFSGLRLAKFNLDTRQSEEFLGLPTPSATFFTLGLLVIHANNTFGMGQLILQPWCLYLLLALLSWLLVSEIPLFSLKGKNLQWSENKLRLTFLAVAVLLLILYQAAAFVPIIIIYVLIGIGRRIFNK